jgi:hypothetical protein
VGRAVERRADEDQKGGLGSAFTRIGFFPTAGFLHLNPVHFGEV